MMSQVRDKLIKSINQGRFLYHSLILLVGKNGSGKTGVLRDIAAEFGS